MIFTHLGKLNSCTIWRTLLICWVITVEVFLLDQVFALISLIFIHFFAPKLTTVCSQSVQLLCVSLEGLTQTKLSCVLISFNFKHVPIHQSFFPSFP